jgi:hypothetical protein
LYFIAVPISYLAESSFIWVTYLLSKIHNGLDVVKRGDLSLAPTTMQPDIKKLAVVYQAVGAHWV